MATQIKTLFASKIDRRIEEVIKVDQTDEGIVVEEIRPGYVFKGQVIRPSLVKVTTHTED